VTCIPSLAFKQYTNPVDLTGLAYLTEVEPKAFLGFRGKLTISGDYPQWKYLGTGAFYNAGDSNTQESSIDLSGASALKRLEDWGLYKFQGKITMVGAYVNLVLIGIGALFGAASTKSVVDLYDLASLRSIENQAFYEYGGVVKISGACPELEVLGGSAFTGATNVESLVEISCTSGVLEASGDAFSKFGGTHVKTGEKFVCSEGTHLKVKALEIEAVRAVLDDADDEAAVVAVKEEL
jgi:hypothetical protein